MSKGGGTKWMISELRQEAVLETQCLSNWTSPSRGYREERPQRALTMREALPGDSTALCTKQKLGFSGNPQNRGG